MSVIFGMHEADKITIVADKREYNIQTNEYNDNSQKLFVIHDQLCIAIAGNNAISKMVNLEINSYKQSHKGVITTDDLSDLLKALYDRIIEKSPSILSYQFCCIYAGIDRNGKASLVSGTRCREGYICRTVPQVIFAPADIGKQECDGILFKNYFMVRGNYPKNILLEVSAKSKFVSTCGDKWVFDVQKKQGTFAQI